MARKSPYPKCILCGRKATRWDGGVCAHVIANGGLKPGRIVWLCKAHDPRHKHFDLPETLSDAIEDLVALREELQKEFVRRCRAEDRNARKDPGVRKKDG